MSSPAVLAPRAIAAPPEAPQSPLAGSRALVEPSAQTSPKAPGDQQAAPRAWARDTAQRAAKPSPPGRRPNGRTIPAGDAGQPAHVVQGRKSGKADIPGTDLRPPPAAPQARPGQAEIPGLLKRAPRPAASPRQLAPYQRHQHAPAAQPTPPGSAFQRAFIEQVAPGAIATQHKYGVPASVTIAQAIDESAWGQSILAAQDHNLFGIKGTGPGRQRIDGRRRRSSPAASWLIPPPRSAFTTTSGRASKRTASCSPGATISRTQWRTAISQMRSRPR